MSNWPIMNGGTPVFLPATTSGGTQGSANIATATAWASPTAWVEVLPSLPFAVRGIHLSASSTTPLTRIDIAIGAAGSEQRIGVPFPGVNFHLVRRHLPIHLPIGTRISARVASAASGNVSVQVGLVPLVPLAPVGYSQWAMFGHDDWASGTGCPVSLVADPGTTVNTKGAWLEVTPAIPFTVRHVAMMCGLSVATSNSGAGQMIDIGMGAAGSEVPVLSNVHLRHNGSARDLCGELSESIHIPAGSRIAIRAQCNSNVNGMRQVGCWLAFGG
ncbi:hypothetical protein MASR1M101_41490 [Gemmatimonas sp.]